MDHRDGGQLQLHELMLPPTSDRSRGRQRRILRSCKEQDSSRGRRALSSIIKLLGDIVEPLATKEDVKQLKPGGLAIAVYVVAELAVKEDSLLNLLLAFVKGASGMNKWALFFVMT